MSVAHLSPAEEAILDGLNEEQLLAVTHGEGPLLIVAGAGTGKTRVVTRRIAWLIATKRARPDEILALTFTEKAAHELEERVDVLVPFGMTGAWMSTFNAFGDRLVREHAIELGLTSQLRVESRAEILVFLREHLFELGLERYMPLGNPEQHLQALMSLFDRARDEDVSPEAYLAFATRLTQEAGADEERKDRAAAELEKARAYAVYSRLLMEHGRVDFGHQISLALRLLRERPYLRREYQDRFRYVLVDEFQDTNYVQFELVKLLCGPRANLTIVGDDDQSIYRFRGARVENLLEFKEVYPGAREILLIRNYRSGQVILDAAHRLIQNNNPERLEAIHHYDKRLRAQTDPGGEVVHELYATASDEADAVAAEIAEGITSGRRRPRDFAVLARSHRHLDPFAAALKARGILFHRTNTRGLYARPEIQLCLNVLRALADPGNSAALYYALADPLYSMDPVDLARLGAMARRYNRGLLALAERALRDPEPWLAPASREALTAFLALHRRLSVTAARRPTSEVLYEFVTDSGLLGRLTAEDSAEALEKVQNLNKLFGIVTRIGPLLVHDRVDQFIQHLDLLIDAGDDPAAAEVETEQDAVQLLTAHNAKGLEFPVVFMVQLAELRFPGSNRPEALPLPPELRRRARAGAAIDHEREERRLFYVGMTRAESRLVLLSALDYGGKQARKISRFVREALGLDSSAKGPSGVSPREAIARFAPAVAAPAPGLAAIPDDAVLDLSHKKIRAYLSCPLKFKFEHVMQVPLPGGPELMYGNAVHLALKVYFQHRLKGIPITIEAVLTVFDEAWSGAGFHNREHEERTRDKGHAILRRYLERAERSEGRTLAVEVPFEFRRGLNRIVGRIDRIEQRADGVALIDYKTGDVGDPEKADQRVKTDLNDGQLGLYALACQVSRDGLPARAELHFISSGLVASSPVEISHAERAGERIDRAAEGIRARRFAPTPDASTCSHCDFSRYCVYSAVKTQP
jgi:DNA helicase-2/ATP-dependent DNA helicase PcrA